MADLEAIVQSARQLQLEVDKIGMGKSSYSKTTPLEHNAFIGLYDVLIKSKELRTATKQLFIDGHYPRAVEEAYKCVNNTVKDRSQLPSDGQDLMNQAFSEKNPVLKLNKLKTASQRDEQKGYMLIFGGCITGIRNPRAHEHTKTDSPEAAIEMLAWANHLMGVVDKAKRVKKSKKISAA